MRGKVQSRPFLSTPARITPAYAGKSPDSTSYDCEVRDHPRVCGEKLNCSLNGFAIRGSPPRMRGKASNSVRSLRPTRITPAYAGKSQSRYDDFISDGDHPRVCGEKLAIVPFDSPLPGSPPRMRGKVSNLFI